VTLTLTDKENTVYITTKQAPELIKDILKVNLVPMISSSPGIGKSDIIRKIAEDAKLKIIDYRLAQADPTDLMGFPTINENKTRSNYAPPITFPLEHDPIPTGLNGFLLFLDEINSAPNSVQAASYKLILDRQIGDHKLHPKTFIIAAGNLDTDRAITNRLSTAMQSRLIHLNISVDSEDWLEWAKEHDIDYRIKAFIKFRPGLLHHFDPKHSDNTYGCPRTWEFLSKIIRGWKEITADKLPVIAGTIGEGTALEFRGFIEIMDSLPDFSEILAAPKTINYSDEPSNLYALTGLLGHRANKKNIKTLIEFIHRLPLEFQVICLQEIISNNSGIEEVPCINDWMDQNSERIAKNVI